MNSRFVIISIFFTFVGCGISVPVQTTTTEGITKKDVSTEVQLRIQYPNTTSSDPTTKPTSPSPSTPSDPTTKPTSPSPSTSSDPTTKTTSPSPSTPSEPTTKTTSPSPSTSSDPTTKTTSPSPSTSSDPTTKPTSPSPTTSPVSTAMTTDTPGGKHSNERQFDGPSFIGGIVLTVGLTAIGFIAFKFYIAGKGGDSKYRTLY